MTNIFENKKILTAYDKIIENEKISESSKGLRRKLQILDDKIDDFMDGINKEIEAIEDNPIFQKQVAQLLADTTKEHSEFLMALKRVASTLDSGAMVIPQTKPEAKDSNGGAPGVTDEPPEEVPENVSEKE